MPRSSMWRAKQVSLSNVTELDACLKALRTRDVLVVWKLDRLGRSLRHLVNTVEDLVERDVGFRVLTSQGGQRLGLLDGAPAGFTPLEISPVLMSGPRAAPRAAKVEERVEERVEITLTNGQWLSSEQVI